MSENKDVYKFTARRHHNCIVWKWYYEMISTLYISFIRYSSFIYINTHSFDWVHNFFLPSSNEFPMKMLTKTKRTKRCSYDPFYVIFKCKAINNENNKQNKNPIKRTSLPLYAHSISHKNETKFVIDPFRID